jgi:hypothetical protein
MHKMTFMRPIYRNAEGGAGGGGNGGQNADAQGGQGAAAAAAAASAAAAEAAANAPKLAWLPDASTEEIAFAQSKGWDKEADAAKVFRSYHNLQKVFGAEKAGNTVILPGDKADDATLNSFYNRLGRPETPDAYSVKEISGLDETQAKDFLANAHKLGITDKQLAGIKEWNDSLGAKLQAELETNVKVEFAKQEATLKQEWGAAFEKNLNDAKLAANKFGLNEEQINAMQIGLGYDGVMKMLATLGAGIGEGKFITGDKGRAGGENNNVMTPEQAKTELGRLGNDPEFQKAWLDKMHPRHKEMVDRKSQLSRWATGQN